MLKWGYSEAGGMEDSLQVSVLCLEVMRSAAKPDFGRFVFSLQSPVAAVTVADPTPDSRCFIHSLTQEVDEFLQRTRKAWKSCDFEPR